MPDLATLRTVVRNQTLAEEDDVSEQNINLFLNQGYRKLSTLFRWPWLEATSNITTVADTQSYALPADYRKLFVVRDNDARATLTRLSIEQAHETFGGDPPSGDQAQWYYVWADSIYLLPIPDSAETDAYTLFYQKKLTVLASDSDVPEFDEEFHLLLTHYAIARVWEHEEDFEKADHGDERFSREIEQMARYYLRREEEWPLVYGNGPRPSLRRVNNMPFLDSA